MASKVILDTDPGIDDAVAIIFALLTLDVRLITLVQGNTHLRNTLRNLRAILTVVKRYSDFIHRPYIPPRVALGQGTRVDSKPNVYAHAFHGQDGLGGYFSLQTDSVSDDLNAEDIASAHVLHDREVLEMDFPSAEEAILGCIEQHKEKEITLVAIGPLSNVSRAMEMNPDVFSKLKSLIIMGGTFDTPGNVSPVAEFNFYADPMAAHLVIAKSPVSTRVVPLDTTTTVGQLGREAVEGCYSTHSNSPITEFLNHILGHAFTVREKRVMINKGMKDDGEGVQWIAMHDPLCIAAVIDETILKWEPKYFEVEPEGKFTSGMCVVDKRPCVLPGRELGNKVVPRDLRVASAQGNNQRFVDLLLNTLFPSKQ